MVETLDKIIEGDHDTIIGMTTEEIIIENRGIKIGVEVEIITGILIETENSREDYSRGKHYSGDGSRTRQSCP